MANRHGKDHDPAFRATGLSVSCSLFSPGSEAPPLSCFQAGYSCTDVDFFAILVGVLSKCYRTQAQRTANAKIVTRMASDIVEAARMNRIPTSMYQRGAAVGSGGVVAGGAGGSQLPGHMLQLFVHKSVAEQHAYPSQAMGIPIAGSITKYLAKDGCADGQGSCIQDQRSGR